MENEDCVRPTTKRELRPQRPPPPAFDPLRTPLQPTRFFQGLATVGGGNLRTMETSVGTHGYRSRAPPGCAALPILLDVVPQLPPGSQVILTTRYDPMRQVMGDWRKRRTGGRRKTEAGDGLPDGGWRCWCAGGALLLPRSGDHYAHCLCLLPTEGMTVSFKKTSEEIESDDEPVANKLFGDLNSVDIESEDFLKLPADVRHDILTDLKETRKLNSWARIHLMPE
ncbi:unnamed protein product, partial [Nesidiocoris tenuis]